MIIYHMMQQVWLAVNITNHYPLTFDLISLNINFREVRNV